MRYPGPGRWRTHPRDRGVTLLIGLNVIVGIAILVVAAVIPNRYAQHAPHPPTRPPGISRTVPASPQRSGRTDG